MDACQKTETKMTSALSSQNIWLALGAAAGIGVIGYAIYFDHSRRLAPDYKEKLRAKRKAAQKSKSTRGTPGINLQDPELLQHFFLSHLQQGEELLMTGQEEEGIEKLALATVASPAPQQVMQLLHQTLSHEQFQMLARSLPTAKKRLFEILGMDDGEPDADEVVLMNRGSEERDDIKEHLLDEQLELLEDLE